MRPVVMVLEAIERKRGLATSLLAAVVLLVLFLNIRTVLGSWPTVKGYEYEWVARSLATGMGFSFDGHHRWLFDPAPAHEFYRTAWVEPVFPFLYAACFRLFGAQGRLAMLLLQALCFAGTLALVFELGRRLSGRVGGLVGATLLALLPNARRVVTADLSNAVFAGLLVSGCAVATLWCIEKVAVRRGLLVGAVLGLTVLDHAGALLLVPLASIAVLSSANLSKPRTWWTAMAVPLTAVVVISPWTVRNYSVFDRLVPVRTGIGQNLHMGNRAVALTFLPEALPAEIDEQPPWLAGGSNEAWRLLQNIERRKELRRYARKVVEATAATGFADFNEAERDQVYLRQTSAFMRQNPGTVAILMLLKARSYFFTKFRYRRLPLAGLLAILSLACGVAAYRDPRVRTVGLFLLGCSAPYLVAAPYFYRYRYPAEPLFAALAGLAVVGLLQLLGRFVGSRPRRRAVA